MKYFSSCRGICISLSMLFRPPLSVIRLGDFKYMRHIRTGEAKLFNLKNDYSEKNNLINSMPEKAKELNDILNEYLIKN